MRKINPFGGLRVNGEQSRIIKSIKAKEILDSRGNPTIEVCLITEQGTFRSSVPSGASKGKYEAVELRDRGKRHQGKGVLKAVNNVNKIIAPKLIGKEVAKQKEIDTLLIKLDGTKNKSKLGANAILAVSMAICRAGASAKNIPLYRHISESCRGRTSASLTLPMPSFNVINGGLHAGNKLNFQEFMIVPQKKSFSENLRTASKIYHQLKKIIKEKYKSKAVVLGDEGGFAPPLMFPEQALELILMAVKRINKSLRSSVKIILDVAASSFFINKKYKTNFGASSTEDLLEYYYNLIKKYPIIGIEDPFDEEDWKGWQKFKFKKILIIGDDLLATNPKRIMLAERKKACNAAIIKINQIGTVTEAIEAAKLAKSFGWKIMVSHRSGETCDDFIADFAVGIKADFIKSGAPAKKERMAKYNRLLKIEKELCSGK